MDYVCIWMSRQPLTVTFLEQNLIISDNLLQNIFWWHHYMDMEKKILIV